MTGHGLLIVLWIQYQLLKQNNNKVVYKLNASDFLISAQPFIITRYLIFIPYIVIIPQLTDKAAVSYDSLNAG